MQAFGAGLVRSRFGPLPATGKCELGVQDRLGVFLFPLPLPWWLQRNGFSDNMAYTAQAALSEAGSAEREAEAFR